MKEIFEDDPCTVFFCINCTQAIWGYLFSSKIQHYAGTSCILYNTIVYYVTLLCIFLLYKHLCIFDWVKDLNQSAVTRIFLFMSFRIAIEHLSWDNKYGVEASKENVTLTSFVLCQRGEKAFLFFLEDSTLRCNKSLSKLIWIVISLSHCLGVTFYIRTV